MFDIGDYVVYGHNGICQVADITHPEIAGANDDKLYYVLIPEKTKNSRLFCPADNTRVVLRKVISSEEAQSIISESKSLEPLTISNDRARDEKYKEILKGCDSRELIQVIKALLIRKKNREDSGKKITATDDRFLKQAEEELYSELSLVSGLEESVLREMITE